MSLKAVAWALDVELDDHLAKLVLICVSNHFNDSQGRAWPSIERIAKVCACSERTVQYKLRKLNELGLITTIYSIGHSSTYVVNYTFEGGARGAGVQEVHQGGAGAAPITLKEHKNNIIKKKTKIADYQFTQADKDYAKGLGLDAGRIIEDIRLWDEQNGNKAAYSNCSAFFKRWCRQSAEKTPRAKVNYGKKPKMVTTHEQNLAILDMVQSQEDWSNQSNFYKQWLHQNKPDIIKQLQIRGIKTCL